MNALCQHPLTPKSDRTNQKRGLCFCVTGKVRISGANVLWKRSCPAAVPTGHGDCRKTETFSSSSISCRNSLRMKPEMFPDICMLLRWGADWKSSQRTCSQQTQGPVTDDAVIINMQPELGLSTYHSPLILANHVVLVLPLLKKAAACLYQVRDKMMHSYLRIP